MDINEYYQEESIYIGMIAKSFQDVIKTVNEQAPEGYFISMPKSAQELFDEGADNKNDVACYIRKIPEEGRAIFFIRRTVSPDRSFITAEYRNRHPFIVVEHKNKKVEDETILEFAELFCKTAVKQGLVY